MSKFPGVGFFFFYFVWKQRKSFEWQRKRMNEGTSQLQNDSTHPRSHSKDTFSRVNIFFCFKIDILVVLWIHSLGGENLIWLIFSIVTNETIKTTKKIFFGLFMVVLNNSRYRGSFWAISCLNMDFMLLSKVLVSYFTSFNLWGIHHVHCLLRRAVILL